MEPADEDDEEGKVPAVEAVPARYELSEMDADKEDLVGERSSGR
jgi:hypothetical protein